MNEIIRPLQVLEKEPAVSETDLIILTAIADDVGGNQPVPRAADGEGLADDPSAPTSDQEPQFTGEPGELYGGSAVWRMRKTGKQVPSAGEEVASLHDIAGQAFGAIVYPDSGCDLHFRIGYGPDTR